MLLLAAALVTCIPLDGDTLVCNGEHIRLLGIDSPEMPGHCRPGRHCVDGDPVVSQKMLQILVGSGRPHIHRYGTDYYGRTLARVNFGRMDASCFQLYKKVAVYVSRWDNGHTVRNHCPAIVRRALRPGQSTAH